LGTQIEQSRLVEDRNSMKVYCVPNFALMLQSQNNPANLEQPASTKNFLSYFSKKQNS
jgi:hypothetical protein